MEIKKIFILFFIFSVIGWIMEEIVCSVSEKKLVNRGFLIGPYCPIYGFGGVGMMILLPYKDDPLVLFVLSMTLCSIIEYIASYIMEKLFNIRWWDYSLDKYNLNGRICLRNAIAFGILGLLVVSKLLPVFTNFVDKLNINLTFYILFTIMLIDFIISCLTVNKIKNNIKNITKDSTDEVKFLIKQKIIDNSYLVRRILKAYTDLNYHLITDKIENYNKEITDKIENYNKELSNKIDNYNKELKRIRKDSNYTFWGLIIGIILGYITKYYASSMFFMFAIGFITDIIIYLRRGKNNGSK